VWVLSSAPLHKAPVVVVTTLEPAYRIGEVVSVVWGEKKFGSGRNESPKSWRAEDGVGLVRMVKRDEGSVLSAR